MAGDLVRALLGLVLPVQCAGCGALDVPWCPDCARLLAGPARRCEQRAGRLDRLDGQAPMPVWTLADCVGPVRQAVVAWKDRGRHDLTRPLRTALADGVREPAWHALGPAVGTVAVVPVPSTAAARRRRGEDLVGQLARGVVAGLRDAGLDARYAPLLRRRRGRDQVGLGARDRARNVLGRVRVRRRRRSVPAGLRVVLVDDVLTTGATLAACRTALAEVGACVVGAFTLAATPPPGATGGPSWRSGGSASG